MWSRWYKSRGERCHIIQNTRLYICGEGERERERERHVICMSLMSVVYYRLMHAKVIFYSFL